MPFGGRVTLFRRQHSLSQHYIRLCDPAENRSRNVAGADSLGLHRTFSVWANANLAIIVTGWLVHTIFM